MNNSIWPAVAAGAAAVTIACGSFALGAAMTSAGSPGGGGTASPPTTAASAAPSSTSDAAAPGVATTVMAGAPTTASAGAGEAVTIVDFAFGPADLSVAAGSTVTWTNDDDVAHSVVSSDAVLSSSDMDQGATYEMTLDQAGTVSYYCGIHQYMKGTITVTP